ncbi:unnamed protein product, partial [Discosporangium mesarthrocarpum]
RDIKTGKVYILGAERLPQLYPVMLTKKYKPEMKADLMEELKTMKGSDLVGLKYKPLFEYYAERKCAFRVVQDGYVTNESGTGIVHQA